MAGKDQVAEDLAPDVQAAPAGTVQDAAQERYDEWSKYIAIDDIAIGGQRAFNAGDPVPISHVDRENAPVDKSQVRLRTDDEKTES